MKQIKFSMIWLFAFLLGTLAILASMIAFGLSLVVRDMKKHELHESSLISFVLIRAIRVRKGKSEWHVAVLLGRVALILVARHLQGLDETQAGVARRDDFVFS